MMRAILTILMSLVVVSVMPDPYGDQFVGVPNPYEYQFVGMPNPYAYQSAYERGYFLCTEFVRLRNWCTNNYATKCTSNADCKSPYTSCVKYTQMRGIFTWYDLHSDSYCTQNTQYSPFSPTCSKLASTWFC